MNKALVSAALAIGLGAVALALSGPISGANAQAGPGLRVVPLGASGQLTWYLDTDKKQVVMCNAFSDNSIECRSKPMP